MLNGVYRGTALEPRRRSRRVSLYIALSILAIAAISVTASTTALAAERPPKPAPAGPVYLHVPYGTKVGQHADVWASTTPNSTTVVLVHGGGWSKGSAAQLKKEASALQAQGFTVFNTAYRLDGPNRPAFPYETNDVIAATQWAIANAASYNADPANVVLVGGSAGANLAALAAEQLNVTRAGTVKAVVWLSGPMNFETLIPLVENGVITNLNFRASIYKALGANEEEGFFGGERLAAQALAREGSPALRIPARNCPEWLLFTSEDDLVPASQAQEMYTDLTAARCDAKLETIPGDQHGFAYWKQVSEMIYSFIDSE